MGAGLHQLGNRAAVSGAFDHEIGDQRDGLGMVELDAALEAATCHHGGHRDQQLVFFAGGEVHPTILEIPEARQAAGAGEFEQDWYDQAPQGKSGGRHGPHDQAFAGCAGADGAACGRQGAKPGAERFGLIGRCGDMQHRGKGPVASQQREASAFRGVGPKGGGLGVN
ncbi:hypothetical protein D3C86_1679870 [compost metagenome]